MDKEGIILGCGIPFSSRLYFAAAASIPTDGGASDDLSASEKRTTDAMRRKSEGGSVGPWCGGKENGTAAVKEAGFLPIRQVVKLRRYLTVMLSYLFSICRLVH